MSLTGGFMTNTLQSHWTAACRLMQSSLKGNQTDQDFFSDHFFAQKFPVEYEFLLIAYFGFFQTYLTSFNDKFDSVEQEKLWLLMWSTWKEESKSPTRIKEFPLLDVTMTSVIKGTFVSEVSDTNTTSQTQQTLKTMAATQNTAYMLPLLASSFLKWGLKELDFKNPIFRQRLSEAVIHGLKPRNALPVVKTPECPDCGQHTVLRYQKQGPNPGQPFWGCLGFPNCRGTLPLYPDPSRYPQFQDDERDETDWFYEYMREVQGPSWDE